MNRARCGLVTLVLCVIVAGIPGALEASVDPGPDGSTKPTRARWLTAPSDADKQAAMLMISVDRALDANDTRTALALLAKLRDLRPGDPTVWNNIGYTLIQAGDLAGASKAFRSSVEIDPGYAQGAFNLALNLVDLNRLDDAYATLQPWTRRIRDYPVMGVLAAKIEQARGHLAEARSLIDQVLAAPGIKPLVLFETANLLREWNDPRAEDAFRRVMVQAPEMIGAALNLADIMRSTKRYGEARKILDDLARRVPDHPSVLRERGGLNAQEGRLEEAVFDLDRAVAKNPQMTDASILAAQCLVKLGRLKDALLRLDSVLDPARKVPDGDRAEARKLRDEILKMH